MIEIILLILSICLTIVVVLGTIIFTGVVISGIKDFIEEWRD